MNSLNEILSSASTPTLAGDKELVVVAMSGGVDSAASAILLHEQGYQVVGVSMQVWDYRKNGGSSTRATCCAPADFDDARNIASKTGFPFYVFDFEDSFYESVISPFADSYVNGYTPNPCVDCNRKVKFHQLRLRARSFGAPFVATGHFAQIKEKADGTLGLFTSVDGDKDQTYFLFSMTQEWLRETIFPVGAMTKPQVRTFLEDRGFAISKKAESQDICFVGSTAGKFVEKLRTDKVKKGTFVSSSGEKLGNHDGIHHFTVGQRRGLGIGHHEKLYVLSIDPDESKVVVGQKSELEQEGCTLADVNWISGKVPEAPVTAHVKLRYRHPGVQCRLEPIGDGRVSLSFINNWTSVTPGQAAVFYSESPDADGDTEVLGGGFIER